MISDIKLNIVLFLKFNSLFFFIPGTTVEDMTVVMTGVVMTETGMIVTMIEEEMTGITTVGTTGTMTEGKGV